jgi:hypothetical protein
MAGRMTLQLAGMTESKINRHSTVEHEHEHE